MVSEQKQLSFGSFDGKSGITHSRNCFFINVMRNASFKWLGSLPETDEEFFSSIPT